MIFASRIIISIFLLTLIILELLGGSAAADEAVLCEEGQGVDVKNDKTCKATRAPPQIVTKGLFQTLEQSSFQNVESIHYDDFLDGAKDSSEIEKQPATISNIPGGESISLQYVQDLVSPKIASKLIESCNKRSGWTSSPQSVDGSATVKATRTSRSCPLIWPQLYLPLLNDPSKASKLASFRDEIDLTWHMTQRIAQFLGIGEEFIEPFQLVRYQPGEFYKEHHDHGSYYGVKTEQRPITLLVFLSDVPSSPGADGGGYTKFRALDEENGGVAVVPRLGDGVLWRNEDDEGELFMEAVHEAVPPKDGGNVIKYAMNVWIAKKKIQENMDVSAYRTR